jgi:hypothetical protein
VMSSFITSSGSPLPSTIGAGVAVMGAEFIG